MKRGLTERTLIAFTSDHGDYLGDHWLGEKDLFHDCSARIPMIRLRPLAPGGRHPRHDGQPVRGGGGPAADVRGVRRRRGPDRARGRAVPARHPAGGDVRGVARLRGERDRLQRPGPAHPARRASLGVPGPHAAHRPVEVRLPRTVPPPALRPGPTIPASSSTSATTPATRASGGSSTTGCSPGSAAAATAPRCRRESCSRWARSATSGSGS